MIGKLGRLYLRMLRYRAAMMIWMFLLLGAAYRGGMEGVGVDHLWAVLAVASSYVCATTVNDIADKDIDRENHPGDSGRPLVTGDATESDLYVLGAAAAAVAVASGALMGPAAVAWIAVGVAIAIAYSAPPLRISYRTYAAPLLLAVGYVAVPYFLGAAVENGSSGMGDASFLGALVALFLARIALKDFRDRRGDALYGRPTLLLRHGKSATCGVSLAALLVGNFLLFYALDSPPLLAIVIELFVVVIAYMLYRLWVADDPHEEQIVIGIGARMGNGLLLCVLGWLLLTARDAPEEHRLAFVLVMAAAYAWNFALLRLRPQDILIGYKG